MAILGGVLAPFHIIGDLLYFAGAILGLTANLTPTTSAASVATFVTNICKQGLHRLHTLVIQEAGTMKLKPQLINL